MKFLVVLLGIFSSFSYIEALCVLAEKEWECGKELGLSTDAVPAIYHDPYPLRARYTDCLWKKLDYITDYGDILYNKIKNEPGALLTIARICDDVIYFEDPDYYTRKLKASIETCKNLLCSLAYTEETAETVRKCIQDHIE